MKPANQPHQENSNRETLLKIQRLIDSEIRQLNESLDNTYEPYMLESEQFKTAVTKARKQLNINDTPSIPDDEIRLWATWYVMRDSQQKPSYLSYMKGIQKFQDVTKEALLESGLPKSLQGLISSYIVTLTPPLSFPVNNFHPAKVTEITDDGIVIKIEKGIRYEEFVAIWKPIASHLGKGRRKTKSRPNKYRDRQIYDKKTTLGLSNRELAKEYLGGEAEYDIDTIKKILKRQGNRPDEGIDFTK